MVWEDLLCNSVYKTLECLTVRCHVTHAVCIVLTYSYIRCPMRGLCFICFTLLELNVFKH